MTTLPPTVARHAVFDLGLSVKTGHAPLANLLEELLEGLSVDERRSPAFVVTVYGSYDHVFDITTPETSTHVRAQAVLPILMAILNDLASRGPGLLVHAGAVERDGRAVVIPGPSGAGKSTLVALLVRAGLGYLSDEVASIELETGRLRPYAKPVALKAGSQQLLPQARPLVSKAQEIYMATTWFLAPRWLHPDAAPPTVNSTLAAVLVPVRERTTSALVPLSRARAAAAIVRSAFNFLPRGAELLPSLAELLRGVDCYELHIGSTRAAAETAVDLVDHLLRGSASGPGGNQPPR